MSPELTFILALVLRMVVTAAFVVSASAITERAGPVIGALIATLPISAGPSYGFLSLDHDAGFIAEGARVSCAGAFTLWIVLAALMRTVDWSLAGGLVANAIAFAICLPLLRRFRHVKMPLITRRWYDIPLRAALVATLVAIVVAVSGWV